jgi:SPP1 family predicted phage head-tail adaptor
MIGGIRVGEMDVKITLRSLTTTKSTITNYDTPSYSDLATVWAKRLGPASKEGYEANQVVSLGTARFMIRRRTDVIETMQIVDGSITYSISGIEDFGRQGYMILTATIRDNA